MKKGTLNNCLMGERYGCKNNRNKHTCWWRGSIQKLEKHYIRWYIEMVEFIAIHIDLGKMGIESAQGLIEHINRLLDSEKERKEINYAPNFLCVLRKQNIVLTEDMDKKGNNK